MKQINAKNYKDFDPGSLSDLIGGNKAQIIEESISGLITIGTYIAQAIANGPRIKRIQALEQFRDLQMKINLKISQEIENIYKELDNKLEIK